MLKVNIQNFSVLKTIQTLFKLHMLTSIWNSEQFHSKTTSVHLVLLSFALVIILLNHRNACLSQKQADCDFRIHPCMSYEGMA